MKRFDVDLVILNERPPSYDQDLQTALEALVRANREQPHSDGESARGTVFVLRADLVSVSRCDAYSKPWRPSGAAEAGAGPWPSRSNVWMQSSRSPRRLRTACQRLVSPRAPRRDPHWSFSTASGALPLTVVNT